MKDLKHLIYFENLLQDANNELIAQAKSEGKRCVAYVCENVPEPLLNLAGIFSIRLRAPRTGSMEMATYYLTSFLCEYSRALLERAIEGGFKFADCIITPDGCTMMNRCVENMELLKTMDKEKFFYEYMEIPMKCDDNGLNLYTLQCTNHILKPLAENFGIDVSDAAIRESVRRHNRVCELIRAIGDFRKEENPRITGYEFHIITLATYAAPQDMLIEKLEETLEELKTREPEPKPWFRARVMVTGAEIDDPEFTKMLEMCGAIVVADRYCFGSMPGREQIEIRDGETALDAIARHYLYNNHCPRAMGPENLRARKLYVYNKAMEYGAEGVIIESMKFCEYWGYERAQDSAWLTEGFALPGTLPVCQIERDYTCAASGQLRTRFQAFVESLEIKRIQAAEQKEGA